MRMFMVVQSGERRRLGSVMTNRGTGVMLAKWKLGRVGGRPVPVLVNQRRSERRDDDKAKEWKPQNLHTIIK